MTGAPVIKGQTFVRIPGLAGHTVIPGATPLVHLNYFDGRFLRAADLQLEQRGLRQLVELSNQAGGPGVINGYDCTLEPGGQLALGAGLAIDPAGRVLLLTETVVLDIAALIEASQARPAGQGASRTAVAGGGAFAPCEVRSVGAPGQILEGASLYLITIGHAEAYCGDEDVFGKLCEDACVTSTERPYLLQGIVVRALPLTLGTALAAATVVKLTGTHLRSLVASAYFTDDDRRLADLISRAGLAADAWCLGARDPDERADVPVALLARAGSATLFLDAWTARRERIEPPPRRYWARRMAMRPWPSFLAQILQFQCQLRELFRDGPTPGVGVDPCAEPRAVLRQAAASMDEVVRFYDEVSRRLAEGGLTPGGVVGGLPGGLTALRALRAKLQASGQPLLEALGPRALITGGIVEVPPAGYLPVVPGAGVTVDEQVRRFMGEGVDLRFCVARPDFVPHALEEVQHMARISLLEGLDAPERRPEVDVLVPDGVIRRRTPPAAQGGFVGRVDFAQAFAPRPGDDDDDDDDPDRPLVFPGVGRAEVLPAGGGAFQFVGAVSTKHVMRVVGTLERVAPVFARGAGDALRRAAAAIDAGIAEVARGARASLASRLHRMARAAALASAARRAERPTFGRPPLAAAAPAAPFEPGLEPGEMPFAMLWLTMRSEQNPLALDKSATTAMLLRFAIAVPAPRNLAVDTELQGTFQVTGRRVVAREIAVTGRFSATSTRRVLAPDTPPDISTHSITYGVEITYRGAGEDRDETLITLTLPDNPNAGISARTVREGSPLVVTTEAESVIRRGDDVDAPQRLHVAGGRLQASADALTVGGTHHSRALQVLDILAAALQQPDFADAAAHLLFPQLPAPPSATVIEATRDWVLFHRRRVKECVSPEPQPVPVPGRTYQLYHLPLETVEEVRRVRAILLQAGPEIGRLPLRPVARVEFAGGQPALLSDSGDLQRDWRAAGPADRLIYGVLGSAPSAAADGEALARARLDRLGQVLAEVTPLHPQAEAELLREVPPDLALPGTDGISVWLTVRHVEEATHCHRVFWLDPAPRKELPGLIEARDVATIIAPPPAGGRPFATELGTVTFPVDDASPRTGQDEVIANWRKIAQGCPPEHVIAFARGNDPTAGSPELRAKRAQLVARALAAEDTVRDIDFAEVDELPGSCAVISLIRPQTVCFDIFHVVLPSDNMERIEGGIEARALARILALNDIVRDGEILLCPRSDTIVFSQVRGALQRFGLARLTIWFRTGDERAEAELPFIEEQAKAMAEDMALLSFAPPELIPSDEDLPSNCPFVVFMMLKPVEG